MLVKQRNFGLDILRAMSIILVFLAHRFSFPYELGIVGVQIFFVLSGFLIGQILIKDFNNGGTIKTILTFWKRRWYRTLPMYYLVLIYKILIYGNPFGWKMIVYFLFLQTNFIGISFMSVSWSLAVEEWFYIFLPIFIFIFFRNGIDAKRFVIFLSCFIFLFFIARFSWNFFNKGVIIYQFDCLLLGVLLAMLKIYYRSIYVKLNSLWLFVFGLFGVIGLMILLGKMDSVYIYNTFYKVTWYFLISITISFMVPFAEQSYILNKTLRNIKPIYYFIT